MQSPLMIRVLARREADQLIQEAIDREVSLWSLRRGAHSAAASAAAEVASAIFVPFGDEEDEKEAADADEVRPSDTPPRVSSGAATPMAHTYSEPVTPNERADTEQRLRRRTVSFYMQSGREKATLQQQQQLHARRVLLEVTTGSVLLEGEASPER